MLEWLKAMENIDLRRICVTIPNDNTPLAYLVRIFSLIKLQYTLLQ